MGWGVAGDDGIFSLLTWGCVCGIIRGKRTAFLGGSAYLGLFNMEWSPSFSMSGDYFTCILKT